jgi:recombination protein RecA
MLKKKPRKVVEQVADDEPQEEIESEPVAESRVKPIKVSDIQNNVRRLLKYSTYEPDQKYWLDTGSPHLNAAIGSREKGLAYGRFIELSGAEHSGKTALSLVLAGMAQRDGAAFGYIDLEESRDEDWSRKLGVDWDNVVQVYTKMLIKGKQKEKFMQTAEELFEEVETTMKEFERCGFEKQFWLLDSIADIQPATAVEAGTTGINMRTRLSRASFLADILPKFKFLARNYNALFILINQLRDKPGVMFGNPETTTGGRALRHACAVRSKVARVKNGLLKKNGKVIGIIGKVSNYKNKVGGGSNQGESCGFKILWPRMPAKYEFMSQEEAEAVLKGETQ